MNIAPKIIQGAEAIFGGKGIAKLASNPIGTEAKSLLSFCKADSNAVQSLIKNGIRRYRIKPDITMPVNVTTQHLQNPAFEISGNLLKNEDPLQLAELGNVARRLSTQYEKALPEAEKQIRAVFDGFDVSIRIKGANSVYSKLKRVMIKGNKKVSTDAQAGEIIQDAIGGRIQLPNLTKADVLETINTIKIDGKMLTAQEKSIVQRLFNNEKLTEAEMEIANKFSYPIKCALAERQSEPVVKNFILAGMKDALERKVTTIEKLEQSGIRKDWIEELKTNPNITPMKLADVNNYKGANGIAYFSDRQIRQFERLQLATGEKHDIISCSESIDLSKYGLEGLSKSAQDAIKPSGYTTGQINVVLKDGTYAEIQVRGTGPFGEYEHLKYDATLGKNTIGEIAKDYVDDVLSLSKDNKKAYDRYAGGIYDFYRDGELGILSAKPQLPKGFSERLSEDYMRWLHDTNEVQQAEKMKTFVPHIEDGRAFIA